MATKTLLHRLMPNTALGWLSLGIGMAPLNALIVIGWLLWKHAILWGNLAFLLIGIYALAIGIRGRRREERLRKEWSGTLDQRWIRLRDRGEPPRWM